MRLRIAFAISSLIVVSAFSAARASAEDAQGFVRREHEALEGLLHGASSPGRDAQIARRLDAMVDYDELAWRAFGGWCNDPPEKHACKNMWAGYDGARRAEARDLLRQLVEKSYRKNLIKTLDYEVVYRGSRDDGGDTRVLTEAKSRVKTREPAVRVDYVVKQTAAGYRVVDIVTEGSSLTKNYYDQFRTMEYPCIAQRLRDRLADKKPLTKCE